MSPADDKAEPKRDESPAPVGDDPVQTPPVHGAGPAGHGAPMLPEQSREDTDAGWGEYSESADDRLYRDRPPHWADY